MADNEVVKTPKTPVERSKMPPLTDEEAARLWKEHKKWLAEIKAAEAKKRLDGGDRRCRACGCWRSDGGHLSCYGSLLCRCSGGSRCGNCLNPNHVY